MKGKTISFGTYLFSPQLEEFNLPTDCAELGLIFNPAELVQSGEKMLNLSNFPQRQRSLIAWGLFLSGI